MVVDGVGCSWLLPAAICFADACLALAPQKAKRERILETREGRRQGHVALGTCRRGSMRSASAGINVFVPALEWPRLREAHISFFRRGLLRCSSVDSDYSADRCIACRIAGSPISQPEKRVVGASGRMAVDMHRHLDTVIRDGNLLSFGCAVAIRMAKSQNLDDRRMGGNNGVRSSGG